MKARIEPSQPNTERFNRRGAEIRGRVFTTEKQRNELGEKRILVEGKGKFGGAALLKGDGFKDADIGTPTEQPLKQIGFLTDTQGDKQTFGVGFHICDIKERVFLYPTGNGRFEQHTGCDIFFGGWFGADTKIFWAGEGS